jgi:hypothetical protein
MSAIAVLRSTVQRGASNQRGPYVSHGNHLRLAEQNGVRNNVQRLVFLWKEIPAYDYTTTCLRSLLGIHNRPPFGDIHMTQQISVRGYSFDEIELEIRAILEQADNGNFDTELGIAPEKRADMPSVADSVEISQGQGISAADFLTVLADFAPVAALIAEDLWTIVIVPKLERKFRKDNVKSVDAKADKDDADK